MLWLNHVMRPALAFVGAVEEQRRTGPGWHKVFYVTRGIVDAAKAGEAVPMFTAAARDPDKVGKALPGPSRCARPSIGPSATAICAHGCGLPTNLHGAESV